MLFRHMRILSSSAEVFFSFRRENFFILSKSISLFFCLLSIFHPQLMYSSILPLKYSFILSSGIPTFFCLFSILWSSKHVFLCLSASWVFFHPQHKYSYAFPPLKYSLILNTSIPVCFSASWVFFHPQHKNSYMLFRLLCILSSAYCFWSIVIF